jgi:hypothetical protein
VTTPEPGRSANSKTNPIVFEKSDGRDDKQVNYGRQLPPTSGHSERKGVAQGRHSFSFKIMQDGGYKGVPAGAIASGFFVAACSLLILYFATVFFVAAPEGRPDDSDRAGIAFGLCLGASALIALWLGWRTKRFFDRRAGRQ